MKAAGVQVRKQRESTRIFHANHVSAVPFLGDYRDRYTNRCLFRGSIISKNLLSFMFSQEISIP